MARNSWWLASVGAVVASTSRVVAVPARARRGVRPGDPVLAAGRARPPGPSARRSTSARRAPARSDHSWLAGIDPSTPAVVLKLDANVMHHGGLGVIRSLGRRGVPVYGVHEGWWAPAASSRYLAGRCFWRPSAEDVERVLAGLDLLAERIGRPAVLLTTDDAGALLLAEHGAGLRGRYLFPDPPADLPRRLAGKRTLGELCEERGVGAPEAASPASPADARLFAARVGYPLVAKLATPWRAGKDLRSTTIVEHPGELEALQRATAAAGIELLLQEHLPGGPGDDWFVHGYADAASQCRVIFTGSKERAYPAHAGLTAYGTSRRNPRLAEEMAAFVAAVGYRGIFDLDLRRDPRDDRYKLLDFNPRLGAQFRLFQDAGGIDVALAQYLDLTGQRFDAAEPVDGRHFLVESYDPLCALSYWRSGELTLRAWAGSLAKVDEAAWFAADDLRPFGLMCVRMGVRLATRRRSR